MKVLVTGGAGFIGSAVVRALLGSGREVVNVDKLTYAANLESLSSVAASPAYAFERADVCDAAAMESIFARHAPDAVIHLAAESHVDRSIEAPGDFIQTNVVGTFTLLEATCAHWAALTSDRKEAFRFIQVSTDEVFGSLGEDAWFRPTTAYNPSSPYAASKASGDHLARAWQTTFGLPTLVTNCANNFGPCQFPEKLIPLVILNAVDGKPLPIYGTGTNERDWLFVDDHAEALVRALERGRPGATYLIGARNPRRNLDVVRSICRLVDELAPSEAIGKRESLIRFVTDRPGHDLRYAIDPSDCEVALEWRPRHAFDDALAKTVRWYLENRGWCERFARGGDEPGLRPGATPRPPSRGGAG
jgi:dTDP-glucose 4,6-dehydratase